MSVKMTEDSDKFEMELDETDLQELYSWIDEIPLSRPKKNISRDFCDGVLIAEIVNHFIPKMAELHNYPPANGNQAKSDNWNLLDRKVLSRIGCRVPALLLKGIISCKPGVIEVFLHNLRRKIATFQAKKKAAALREKNPVYDELGGDLSSRSNDYYRDSYQYGDGLTNQFQNGHGAAYPPAEHGYGSYPNNPQQFYPQNHNAAPQQAPYYYQSEPRAVPENRQYPSYPNEAPKQPRPQPLDKPSRSDLPGKTKPADKRIPRAQSLHDGDEIPSLRIALEEKEQALLSSQETVQILQVKVRRLEHLLHLKNLRIDDLNSKLNTQQHTPPHNQLPLQHLPPGPHAPVPPLKQHPPLPGIYPKAAGGLKNHR